jgi:methionyl aminopeptidase
MAIPSSKSELIVLKGRDWFLNQKHAGKAVANALKACAHAVQDYQPLTLLDLEELAVAQLDALDCTPTFLGYRGFPGKICTSVNKTLVHGIPSDYQLQDGDMVTVDLGATYQGSIADAAYTVVYGEPAKHVAEMMSLCKGALQAAVKAVKVGERLGVIGHAIYEHVRGSRFGVVTAYGGHGIDTNTLHSSPFVPNKSRKNEGPRIQPGLSIAIEPMLTLAKNTNTKTLPDKWSIVTRDVGCHFEHSVTVDQDGSVHMITEHGMEYE